jgi:hypothetical protein
MTPRILLLVALLVLTAAAPAAAQADRAAEAHKRNDCRLAGQVLASGQPHPRYEWARAAIVDCEEEGPVYFAAQWDTAPADSSALRQMIAGSSRVRDARVYASLRQTATDASRPSVVRVAAMIALAEYVDPHISIDLSELRVPEGPIARIRFRGGSAVDVVQVPGTHPLGSIRAEVLDLLNPIASNRSGEPREVWYAAAVLARRIEMDAGIRQSAHAP